MLVTMVLAFLVVLAVVVTLLTVRTPRYRLRRENIIALLGMVLSGQASSNDWSVFTEMPIREDEYLDSIRLRCIEIEEREYTEDGHKPYLFTSRGLEELRAILDELNTDEPEARL